MAHQGIGERERERDLAKIVARYKVVIQELDEGPLLVRAVDPQTTLHTHKKGSSGNQTGQTRGKGEERVQESSLSRERRERKRESEVRAKKERQRARQ